MFEDVEFSVPGAILRGRLYLPDDVEGPHPVVIAHSGIGSVAEGTRALAPIFTAMGLGVLFYDHRGFGLSDGETRQLVDPWQFGRDLRHVITHLSLRTDIDESRIALWGVSLGGLVSLFAASTDRRISAICSIVPPVSGWSARKLFPPEQLRHVDDAIYADRAAQLQGMPPKMLITSGERTPGGPPVMFTDQAGIDFVGRHYNHIPSFRNELAIGSLDHLFEIEAPAYAERLNTPLLLVLASDDTVAPASDAREMFERVASRDKELIEYPGQHYGILVDGYEAIVKRTAGWLCSRLGLA
ncbi:alpha-beta hydrolase superfamily lysophospholipase [Pseudomonas sp. F-14 TE3623]